MADDEKQVLNGSAVRALVDGLYAFAWHMKEDNIESFIAAGKRVESERDFSCFSFPEELLRILGEQHMRAGLMMIAEAAENLADEFVGAGVLRRETFDQKANSAWEKARKLFPEKPELASEDVKAVEDYEKALQALEKGFLGQVDGLWQYTYEHVQGKGHGPGELA